MRSVSGLAVGFASRLSFVIALALGILCCRPSSAAPISYGDFVGSTVTYRMVMEDSGTDTVPPGMFGEPTIGGNTLNFRPSGFDSASTNGVSDITDGQLSFMVESNNKQTQSIQNVLVNEVGDTTLAGNVPVGSIATSASANLAPLVQIVEVDGVAIPPITLSGLSTPPLPVLTTVFTHLPSNSPSDGTWHLGVDGNGGPSFSTQWNGRLFIDIHDALVKSGMSFTRGATKVTANLNNVLASTSETGTSATIAKKDFFTITTNIPEPAASVLAIMGLACGLVSRRWRQ
jgi:hypothetical protein